MNQQKQAVNNNNTNDSNGGSQTGKTDNNKPGTGQNKDTKPALTGQEMDAKPHPGMDLVHCVVVSLVQGVEQWLLGPHPLLRSLVHSRSPTPVSRPFLSSSPNA